MFQSPTPQLTSPFVMVIFGATGDLAQRKLIPALFHLFQKKVLPEHFFIVGFSRRDLVNRDFKEFLLESIKKYDTNHVFDEAAWRVFSGKIYYRQGEFEEKKAYSQLITKLAEFDDNLKACVPRFFYLATPPDKYATILKYLHETKLSEGCGQGSDKWTKVMIEKPFGRSMQDARSLDELLSLIFKEEQIYRIDHYLGKETVQNILAFRYSNGMFDPVWNRQFIDHVQITIAETIGVEARGNFFEGVGTLRDMTQSHLLELMAAIAMKPQRYDSAGIRDGRAHIIASINAIEPEDVGEMVVRGQYGSGSWQLAVGSSQNIKAYRQEPNVDSRSFTETFVAAKLTLSDPRWQGVPFYMRTGKRLVTKATQISVVFKEPQHLLFKNIQKQHVGITIRPSLDFPQIDHSHGIRLASPAFPAFAPDILTFRIEPDEGIELRLNAKRTGFRNDFDVIPLAFTYQQPAMLPEAYERLLVDVMKGEQTLFTRTDEVASAWKFIGKIVEGWERERPHFPNYAPGTWGPEAADKLIKKDGREWLLK